MARITSQDREHNEAAIRAAMDRLLRGDIPPGGKCDLKTLAAEAGITRTGFYPKKDRHGLLRQGAYQHLAQEFDRRFQALRDAGDIIDPRAGQVEQLKQENAKLKERLQQCAADIEALAEFKQLALSRLAAQHEEILRLRQGSLPDNVRPLRPRGP